ncbi:bifunctional adenosylcobinamide kinase/adenosylcobinamide-phosphate guanylyltransferase [Bacillus sp. sid0103]|uniref:bifunctional adenosylcobinamide kinase/adenosylcobinamide-phosphate guanylyltransferase n=1 Tax=Bacillus sp. sid0103 TaxID=2856337 RepID=UPI001C459033|nr:bifunctional adenosylcobinamide kinase/adenosylcobinamide-phosphate guanylyltransferase [Bacillus sp. sid0103]MBV7504651.1 bifunctional adenosylcobinamide kinase/adenosylcobinamide-phosphate guanylyltransferase [Bacillus sp. sid0103]
MHFIIGGAFNGKRAWVKNTYSVYENKHWVSAYDNHSLPINLIDFYQDVVILEGVEIWLKELTATMDADKCRVKWVNCLEEWLNWEQAELQRQLIVIGTDISKGIVPMEAANRRWRDVTGWAYQDIAAKSEKVDLIWYGLNQTIK